MKIIIIVIEGIELSWRLIYLLEESDLNRDEAKNVSMRAFQQVNSD